MADGIEFMTGFGPTEADKVRAQEVAWALRMSGSSPKLHLIGPAELQALFNEIASLKAQLKVEKCMTASLRRDLMRARGIIPPTCIEDDPGWPLVKQKPAR